MAEKDDDKKSLADKQRESIEVTSTSTIEAADEADKKEDKVEENDKEEKEPEDKVEEVEEEIEAKEDEVEDLETEKAEAKTDKEKERIQKRINKLTADKAVLKAENEALKRQLAAKPDDEKVFTEDEIERRSEEKANQKAALKEFNDAQENIIKSGTKVDKDFLDKVKAMAEEVSPLPGLMVGILNDLPNNGGDVLNYLTENVDEYEEIYQLSPARMALKLKGISDKLKPTKKAISKVPPPKEPVSGKGETPDVLKDDMEMSDWVKLRNKQAEAHRKMKLGLH